MIIVKRTLTEPKTAFAGVALETSFARFKASIATFSKEMAFSWRFCRLEIFGSMVEGRGSREETVVHRLCGRTRTLNEMGGHSVMTCLVRTVPFDEGNLFVINHGKAHLGRAEYDRLIISSFVLQPNFVLPPCRPGENPYQLAPVYGFPNVFECLLPVAPLKVHHKLKHSPVTYPPPVSHLQ